MPATMFDKIWDPHVVADLGGGWSLLYCDRVLVHDLSGGRALQEVGEAGYKVARPDLVFATPDHAVSSAPGRTSETFPTGARLLAGLPSGVLIRRLGLAQAVRETRGFLAEP